MINSKFTVFGNFNGQSPILSFWGPLYPEYSTSWSLQLGSEGVVVLHFLTSLCSTYRLIDVISWLLALGRSRTIRHT